MANRVCWKCGAVAHMDRLDTHWLVRDAQGVYLNFAVFRCASCQWGVIGTLEGSGIQPPYFDTAKAAASIEWYPKQAMSKAFPDVPIQIGAAAGEATGCFSVEHYRAAVILARAVVEATAKDKGFTKGTLADKIDAMQAAGRIRPHTKDAAHEIRYMGNDMAHGDFATTIEKDEADDVLNFMSEILEEIYQGPARVDRQRAARLAKKAPVQAGP